MIHTGLHTQGDDETQQCDDYHKWKTARRIRCSMLVSASKYHEGEDSSAKEFGEKRRDGSHVVHLETQLSF